MNFAGECASHTVLVIEQTGSFRVATKESRSLSSMEPLARSSKLELIPSYWLQRAHAVRDDVDAAGLGCSQRRKAASPNGVAVFLR